MSILALPDYRFLPAPLWLLTALHILTLVLHLVAMNFLLGGLIAVLMAPIEDRWNNPLVQRLVKLFPTLTAVTVTLGVAPLLFVQLVFGRVIYAASIVSGWFWLAIPAAVMLAYAGFYAAAFAAPGAARVRRMLWAALFLLLFVSLTYSSVFSLAEDPEAQRALYGKVQSGLAWNPDVGGWFFRWLHMVTGAVTVGGFLLALLGRGSDAEFKLGKGLFLAGMVLATLTGIAYLLTLGDDLLGFMRSAGIWWLTAGVVLALGSLHFVFKRRFVIGGGMLFASVVGMVVSRHVLRLIRLEGHLDPATMRVEPQWAVFGLFLLFFVGGLAVVAWMLRIYFRGDRGDSAS